MQQQHKLRHLLRLIRIICWMAPHFGLSSWTNGILNSNVSQQFWETWLSPWLVERSWTWYPPKSRLGPIYLRMTTAHPYLDPFMEEIFSRCSMEYYPIMPRLVSNKYPVWSEKLINAVKPFMTTTCPSFTRWIRTMDQVTWTGHSGVRASSLWTSTLPMQYYWLMTSGLPAMTGLQQILGCFMYEVKYNTNKINPAFAKSRTVPSFRNIPESPSP